MKKMLLGATSLLVLIAAGCSNDSGGSGSATSTTGGSANSGAGKTFKLAFVTNNSSPFWVIARKGVEKADQELPNVEAEFRMPTQGTAAEQTQVVDDLLAKGVDGIAISPVDPANETELINKAAGQTLVFTQDSDAPASNRACYVGTDNVAAGRQAGEELKKALPNGGKVYAFVGSIDAQNAKDRIAGLKEAIQGSKIVLVDVRTDGTDRAKAKSNVADTLVKDPDVAGFVGIWSYNGPLILNAVSEAGKVGKVRIVCFDEEDETLAGVKDGSIFATIVQQPYEFGYQAIHMMAKVLEGDKASIPSSKMNIIPTKVITATDVDEFKANLDKLRG